MEKLPFIPNHIYNRRAEIHALYGGNWQSGICPSANHPYIFIFSGKSGKQNGYKDGWDNPNIFSYTGEGQSGYMKFTKGNLALRVITFANSGNIILSDSIECQAFEKIGVDGKEKIKNLSTHNFEYLEKHRTRFQKGV